MPKLDSQIRDYFDHVVDRVDAEDLLLERSNENNSAGISRLSLVLAATAVVLTAAAVTAILRSPADDVVIIEPATSPVVTEPSTTVTTTTSAIDDTTTALVTPEGGGFSLPEELIPDRVVQASTSVDVSELVWEQITIPESLFGDRDYLSSIVAMNQRLVILGLSECGDERVAAVWTSVDGYLWSRVPHDPVFHLKPTGSPQCPRGFQNVVVGGPGLVVEGQIAGPSNLLQAAVWTSPDGVSWSRTSPDGTEVSDNTNSAISKMYLGGPGLVAIGASCETDSDTEFECLDYPAEVDQRVIWTSADGVTWGRVEPSGGGSAFDASSDPEHFVARADGFVGALSVGNGVEFWTSQVGVDWINVPDSRRQPESCLQWLGLSLIATDNTYLATSDCNDGDSYHTTFWASTDGTNWSVARVGGNDFIRDVIVVGNTFVAVGGTSDFDPEDDASWVYRPAVWTSTDGLSWTKMTPDSDMISDGEILKVAIGGPGLVAYGESLEPESRPTLWVAKTKSDP